MAYSEPDFLLDHHRHGIVQHALGEVRREALVKPPVPLQPANLSPETGQKRAHEGGGDKHLALIYDG